jgi:hypothetical protein
MPEQLTIVDDFTAIKDCLTANGLSTGNTDQILDLARSLSEISEEETNQIIAAGILLG